MPNRTTRHDLRTAAVRLGARHGVESTSIRSIAREAGVTEGAVYKHFDSKDDLIREAYSAVVQELARDKAVIARAGLPFDQALRAWIKLTYDSFDTQRDAFTYVLLMPHRIQQSLGEITELQGNLFRSFYTKSVASGQAHDLPANHAYALFTGLVLNIPRLIDDGTLTGPAADYTDLVADAACALFVTGHTPKPPT